MQDVGTSRVTPWISVWFRPRKTIDHIVASPSGRYVPLLAGLGGFAGVASFLIQLGVIAEIKDWRFLLGAVLLGALSNIIQLYVTAFVIAWVARKLGSSAPTSDVRAALAWGAMPVIFAGALMVLLVLSWNTGGSVLAARLLSNTLQVILGAAGLWLIIITTVMLLQILKLGRWRTISVYVVCGLLSPLVVTYAIRMFLFEPFNVLANSMAPTLLTGDYVFASKLQFSAVPKPGDVVVFAAPINKSTYLKRVVGLPGDRIQMKSGELLINGVAVTRERLPDYTGDKLCGEGTTAVKRWRETLPNGVSYETLDCVENAFYDNTQEFVVPAGQVFVMGDNRDNSTDSRVQQAFGTIPVGNIFGRAGLIFLSRTGDSNSGGSLRLDRMGMIVR